MTTDFSVSEDKGTASVTEASTTADVSPVAENLNEEKGVFSVFLQKLLGRPPYDDEEDSSYTFWSIPRRVFPFAIAAGMLAAGYMLLDIQLEVAATLVIGAPLFVIAYYGIPQLVSWLKNIFSSTSIAETQSNKNEQDFIKEVGQEVSLTKAGQPVLRTLLMRKRDELYKKINPETPLEKKSAEKDSDHQQIITDPTTDVAFTQQYPAQTATLDEKSAEKKDSDPQQITIDSIRDAAFIKQYPAQAATLIARHINDHPNGLQEAHDFLYQPQRDSEKPLIDLIKIELSKKHPVIYMVLELLELNSKKLTSISSVSKNPDLPPVDEVLQRFSLISQVSILQQMKEIPNQGKKIVQRLFQLLKSQGDTAEELGKKLTYVVSNIDSHRSSFPPEKKNRDLSIVYPTPIESNLIDVLIRKIYALDNPMTVEDFTDTLIALDKIDKSAVREILNEPRNFNQIKKIIDELDRLATDNQRAIKIKNILSKLPKEFEFYKKTGELFILGSTSNNKTPKDRETTAGKFRSVLEEKNSQAAQQLIHLVDTHPKRAVTLLCSVFLNNTPPVAPEKLASGPNSTFLLAEALINNINTPPSSSSDFSGTAKLLFSQRHTTNETQRQILKQAQQKILGDMAAQNPNVYHALILFNFAMVPPNSTRDYEEKATGIVKSVQSGWGILCEKAPEQAFHILALLELEIDNEGIKIWGKNEKKGDEKTTKVMVGPVKNLFLEIRKNIPNQNQNVPPQEKLEGNEKLGGNEKPEGKEKLGGKEWLYQMQAHLLRNLSDERFISILLNRPTIAAALQMIDWSPLPLQKIMVKLHGRNPAYAIKILVTLYNEAKDKKAVINGLLSPEENKASTTTVKDLTAEQLASLAGLITSLSTNDPGSDQGKLVIDLFKQLSLAQCAHLLHKISQTAGGGKTAADNCLTLLRLSLPNAQGNNVALAVKILERNPSHDIGSVVDSLESKENATKDFLTDVLMNENDVLNPNILTDSLIDLLIKLNEIDQHSVRNILNEKNNWAQLEKILEEVSTPDYDANKRKAIKNIFSAQSIFSPETYEKTGPLFRLGKEIGDRDFNTLKNVINEFKKLLSTKPTATIQQFIHLANLDQYRAANLLRFIFKRRKHVVGHDPKEITSPLKELANALIDNMKGSHEFQSIARLLHSPMHTSGDHLLTLKAAQKMILSAIKEQRPDIYHALELFYFVRNKIVAHQLPSEESYAALAKGWDVLREMAPKEAFKWLIQLERNAKKEKRESKEKTSSAIGPASRILSALQQHINPSEEKGGGKNSGEWLYREKAKVLSGFSAEKLADILFMEQCNPSEAGKIIFHHPLPLSRIIVALNIKNVEFAKDTLVLLYQKTKKKDNLVTRLLTSEGVNPHGLTHLTPLAGLVKSLSTTEEKSTQELATEIMEQLSFIQQAHLLHQVSQIADDGEVATNSFIRLVTPTHKDKLREALQLLNKIDVPPDSKLTAVEKFLINVLLKQEYVLQNMSNKQFSNSLQQLGQINKESTHNVLMEENNFDKIKNLILAFSKKKYDKATVANVISLFPENRLGTIIEKIYKEDATTLDALKTFINRCPEEVQQQLNAKASFLKPADLTVGASTKSTSVPTAPPTLQPLSFNSEESDHTSGTGERKERKRELGSDPSPRQRSPTHSSSAHFSFSQREADTTLAIAPGILAEKIKTMRPEEVFTFLRATTKTTLEEDKPLGLNDEQCAKVLAVTLVKHFGELEKAGTLSLFTCFIQGQKDISNLITRQLEKDPSAQAKQLLELLNPTDKQENHTPAVSFFAIPNGIT